LVDSALTTVESLGHESLSVRDAARSVGVTHTAAYRHFADRDALLAAVASQGFRAMRGTILRGLKRGGEDALERSIQGGVACVVYCVEHARLVRLMVAASSRRPGDSCELEAARQLCFDLLVAVVMDCQKQRRFVRGDPKIMAVAIWAQIYGLAQLIAEGMLGRDLTKRKVKELACIVERMLVTGLMQRDDEEIAGEPS
jgi:AcrR family transcriptional regulator